MRRYIKEIEPEKYAYLSEEILDRFDSQEPDSIVELAAGHKMLYDEIDYHKRNISYSPENILEDGSGSCVSHSILLATLYKACGLQPALLSVRDTRNENPHLLVEVKNPLLSIEDACDSLRRVYYNQFDQFCPEFGYEEHGGSQWFVVDTAGGKKHGWSSHVGDISCHYGSYIQEKQGGDWQWHNLKKRREV